VIVTDDFAPEQSSHNKVDLSVFKKGEYHPVKDNTWKEILGY